MKLKGTLSMAGTSLVFADGATGQTTLRSNGTGTRVLDLPDASDTLVGRDTTDTLTNKTFTAPALGAATATSINKVIITAPASTATLTIANNKTFTVSNTLTLTGTDGSSVAFGAGGTVAYVANKLSAFAATTSSELAGVISDEAGSGSLVFATSPTLVTPTLGVASATSINKVAITAPASSATLTIADGKTLTASNTLTFTGTDSSSVAFGAGGTVVYTSNKLSVFAATTSSELAGVISDETGSGSLVFANTPTLVTPVLGVATATSINGLTITTSTGTLTITNAKTLAVSNSLTFTGTDASSVAFGTGGTVAYVANKLSVFAATTSAELKTVISDETGTGALVFADGPTLIAPVLGTPASGTLTNCTGLPIGGGGTGQATAAAAFKALAQYSAKGDLPGYTGTTAGVLGVGTNGQVLTADSTATNGFKWGDGGAGAGEINAVLNPSAASATTGWAAGTSHTVTRDTSHSPLDPAISTCLAIAASNLASDSSTSGVGYTISTFPAGLRNRKTKVEFWMDSTGWDAADSWYFSLYSGSTRVALSTDVSSATLLPNGYKGKFTAYFDADASTTYSVRYIMQGGPGSSTVYVTNLVVGPGIQPQGAVVGPWLSGTSTITGSSVNPTFGTLDARCEYRRVGSSLEILYHLRQTTAGTTGTGTYLFGLPLSGVTIDTSVVKTGASTGRQNILGTAGGQDGTTGATSGYAMAWDSSHLFLQVGNDSTSSGFIGSTLHDFGKTTVNMSFHAVVPIAEWAGGGTANLAQNDVEYAYNTSGTTSAGGSDTTSFGYGLSGATIGSINSATVTGASVTTMRVRFTTPIQPTDSVWVEVDADNTGLFVPAISRGLGRIAQGTGRFGVAVQSVSGSSTDVDVSFGNGGIHPSNATYASAGAGWSSFSTGKWRVVKAKSGQTVGFGLATATASGLVNAAVTFNPTLTIVSNLDSTPTVTAGKAIKTGGLVTVLLTVSADPTTGASWGASFPVTSLPWALNSSFNVIGSGYRSSNAANLLTVYSNGTDVVLSAYGNSVTSAASWSIVLQYYTTA